jgi:hypothetical protein
MRHTFSYIEYKKKSAICAPIVCVRALFHLQGQLYDQKNAFLFTGTIKISTLTKRKQPSTKNNHYDTPKIHYNNENLALKRNYLVTSSNNDNTLVNVHNNNLITNDTVSTHFSFFLLLFLPFFYAYKKDKMKSSFVINCFCLLATRQSY